MMEETSDIVLSVEGLHKVFKDFWGRPRAKAVNGIDFEVKRGEVFGLLGPNGSGKSTTIKMLLGLLHPTRGKIQVLGKPPRDVQSKVRIGYLPEESYLYPYLTARETLDFYGRLFDLSGPERKQRIDQLLEMVGLQHTGRRTIKEFSKGMARRIGLAQALINNPEIVILDEPTSGLDPIGTRQVKDLIHTLSERGKTVFLSSHLLADVEDVCDRIAILYDGHVQAEGSIADLLQVDEHYLVPLSGLTPDQLQNVLRVLRETLGTEPELKHPRRNLEQFFMEVISKARASGGEISGAGEGKQVADYLQGAEEASDESDVLEEILKERSPEPNPGVADPASEPVAPAGEGLDGRIDQLLGDQGDPKDE
jgi:ABC-2 type transport system ATP-binding protein